MQFLLNMCLFILRLEI